MKFYLWIILSLCFINVHAQNSTKTYADTFFVAMTEKFAQTRILNIQYSYIGSQSFDTRFLGEDVGEGHLSRSQRTEVNVNLPIKTGKKWRITYSGNYRYNNYNFDDKNSFNGTKDYHYFNSAGSFTYFSSFLHKPIIYNGSLIVDASNELFGRVKGFASAVMILKSGRMESMSVGIVGLVDHTNNFPVIPTFSYTKVYNNKWRLDMVLPLRIMLQTQLGKTGRISLGSEFTGDGFYFKSDHILDNKNKYEFRQSYLKSGFTYEYLIANKFVLTAKAGFMNTTQSRISQKGNKFNEGNYLIKFKPDGAAYASLGISFNPF